MFVILQSDPFNKYHENLQWKLVLTLQIFYFELIYWIFILTQSIITNELLLFWFTFFYKTTNINNIYANVRKQLIINIEIMSHNFGRAPHCEQSKHSWKNTGCAKSKISCEIQFWDQYNYDRKYREYSFGSKTCHLST